MGVEASLPSGPLDSVQLHIRFRRGLPQGNWDELLDKVRAYQAAVERQPWLLEWKKARPGRRLFVQAGPDPKEMPSWMPTALVNKDWSAYQLYVLLREATDQDVPSTVMLSQDGSRCDVFATPPRKVDSPHWFDHFKLSPGEYAIVRDGVPERRKMPTTP